MSELLPETSEREVLCVRPTAYSQSVLFKHPPARFLGESISNNYRSGFFTPKFIDRYRLVVSDIFECQCATAAAFPKEAHRPKRGVAHIKKQEGVDNNGIRQTFTVNGKRYYSMLQNVVIHRLRNHNMENIIFMQDGAPPHTFIPGKQLITQMFGDRVISRHFPKMWHPRSPDCNPADFWLWGYLKERVFLTHPTTLLQLKQDI
ncbi:hypothetical protein ANN_26968 [Periplaneta americana]|uniref:Tc1-like transposase DDE domain-containing protein n=1 Tax=Periplaneta americana TaxID=6978 RepID=A0ABQ8RWR5_PERAM|nr:hypothetical protein ANN_26968 [Periplaneta americana]